MNKKVVKTNSTSYKTIIFWGVIAILTLAFVVTIVIRFIGSRTINSYDSIDHVVGDEIFEKKEETYLVYLYSSDDEYSEAVDAMEEIIFNYVTFQGRNDSDADVYKMYAADLSNPENAKSVVYESTTNVLSVDDFDSLKVSDKSIPVLLVIKDGSVISYDITDNDISDYLQTIIDENK
ncbi:MAG: hypothetical protein PHO86_01155 [Bacilli bacterium]|nr:hypothetical protein [Bacilli bacterium]